MAYSEHFVGNYKLNTTNKENRETMPPSPNDINFSETNFYFEIIIANRQSPKGKQNFCKDNFTPKGFSFGFFYPKYFSQKKKRKRAKTQHHFCTLPSQSCYLCKTN